MDKRVTPQEHPLTAVILHWMHMASFVYLMATGIMVMRAPEALQTSSELSRHHMVGWVVFLLTAFIRYAWAFLGDGSAEKGSHELVSDWRHFTFKRGDGREVMLWLTKYAKPGTDVPRVAKYNPLQKIVYAICFPAAIVLMAISGFALSPSFSGLVTWFTDLIGGVESARLIHDAGMLLLIALSLLHLYAAIYGGAGRILMMLVHWVPEKYRAV